MAYWRGKKRDLRILVASALRSSRMALHQVRRARWRLERHEESKSLLLQLLTLEYVLERIILRLETIAVSGLVTRELLALPLALIRELEHTLGPALPEATALIEEIGSALEEAYESAAPSPSLGGLSEGIPDTVREEARLVIEEARREADKRLRGQQEEPLGAGGES